MVETSMGARWCCWVRSFPAACMEATRSSGEGRSKRKSEASAWNRGRKEQRYRGERRSGASRGGRREPGEERWREARREGRRWRRPAWRREAANGVEGGVEGSTVREAEEGWVVD